MRELACHWKFAHIQLTFKICPQRGVKVFLICIFQHCQQTAAGATERIYHGQKAANEQRKAPPHLEQIPRNEAES
jgi:hypothetical protein